MLNQLVPMLLNTVVADCIEPSGRGGLASDDVIPRGTSGYHAANRFEVAA